MHSVTRTIFPVFAFKVTHRVILLTRFCNLLTRVATLSGGGEHVPRVPQWHDASGPSSQNTRVRQRIVVSDDMNCPPSRSLITVARTATALVRRLSACIVQPSPYPQTMTTSLYNICSGASSSYIEGLPQAKVIGISVMPQLF